MSGIIITSFYGPSKCRFFHLLCVRNSAIASAAVARVQVPSSLTHSSARAREREREISRLTLSTQVTKVQLHENSIPHQKKKFFFFLPPLFCCSIAVCVVIKNNTREIRERERENKNARRSHKSLCSGPCYSIRGSRVSFQVHDKQALDCVVLPPSLPLTFSPPLASSSLGFCVLKLVI